MKLQDPDDLIDVAPRTDESTPPPTDIPLSIIPTLTVTEAEEAPCIDEQQSKAVPEDKLKNTLLPPVVRLRNTHAGILKRESSSSKVKLTNMHVNPEEVRRVTGASPAEIRWQSNYLNLAERKSTSFLSPDLKSKGSFRR